MRALWSKIYFIENSFWKFPEVWSERGDFNSCGKWSTRVLPLMLWWLLVWFPYFYSDCPWPYCDITGQKSKSISSPEQNYFVHFALRYPCTSKLLFVQKHLEQKKYIWNCCNLWQWCHKNLFFCFSFLMGLMVCGNINLLFNPKQCGLFGQFGTRTRPFKCK